MTSLTHRRINRSKGKHAANPDAIPIHHHRKRFVSPKGRAKPANATNPAPIKSSTANIPGDAARISSSGVTVGKVL
jgi:hypothetical protein